MKRKKNFQECVITRTEPQTKLLLKSMALIKNSTISEIVRKAIHEELMR